jgi:membrane protein YdbS with pleckstrin-like domain
MAEPPRPRRFPDLPAELEQYLFDVENVKFRVMISRLRLWLPFMVTLAGVLLYAIILANVSAARQSLQAQFWMAVVLFISPLSWLVWQYFDWRLEYFIVTDRRLMLVHGVITRKVAIMPLGKVTDMAYNRSPVAKLLGYGTFVFESAGQDQALSTVNWVTDPDKRYREISALIFAPPSRRAFDKLLPFATGSAMPISEPDDAWWKR